MIYFAWVDSTETTFSALHHRSDEDVFSFTVDHVEGDFPSLSLEIKNPRVGLLAPLRKRWAWLAYSDGVTVTPLFFGRLVGVPEGTEQEIMRLTFVARPADYQAQKDAVAAGLRVLPWFDPVWIAADRRADPDVVLEARTAMWHIDRTSLAVTASDIVAGEDGTVNIAGDFWRDSLSMRYSQIPARSVNVSARMTWKQEASGTVDVSRAIADAFGEAGTDLLYRISSYTGDGLSRDWPKTGQRIGSGWTVGEVKLPRVDGWTVQPKGLIANTALYSRAYFPLWYFQPTFKADFAASRDRLETVSFTVNAGTQDMLADLGDDDAIDLSFSSSAAAEAIDGAYPIGDLTRRSYFQTDRGRDSLRHLMLVARARLIAQARAVEIEAEIPFATAIGLSCRKSATLTDARIPGGTATGKIVGYSFGLSGDDGAMLGSVTVACTIGTGGSLGSDAAVPGYVTEGYADDWQAYTGGDEVLASGDLAFGHFDVAIADDGVIFDGFRALDAVEQCIVVNGPTAQAAVLGQPMTDAAEAIAALNEAFTEVQLTLKPLDRLSFVTDYPLAVSDLVIPKTIDLEAA